MNRFRRLLLLVVVLASLVLSAPATQAQGVYEAEHEILLTFYDSTGGDFWTNKTNWKTNPDHCTWYGVGCNGEEVISLSLPSNQLRDSLPAELGRLTNLQQLNLYGNRLTGFIPPEVGNLSNLQTLNLGGPNRLSGPIPPQLGNLINLQYLDLSGNNQLSGSVPPELGNLTNLQTLSLNGNRLTGFIPPELSNLTNLWSIKLTGNQLSGSIPSELGNLTNLRVLSLAQNQLSGSIPPELGNLTNLKTLDLTNNPLSGSIPPQLGNLTNLESLFLINNQLTGPIPPELGNMTNLLVLNLRGNDPSLCVSTAGLLGFFQSLSYYEGPPDLCNSPPTADAGGPYSGNEGSEINFDASATTDPDGDELQYRWDFNNDGSWDTEWSPVPVTGYTWDDDWMGQAKVEVTDGLETVSDTADVTIYNVAPIATFANTADPYLGLPNTLTAGESASLVFSNPFDPSGPDTVAGFTYSYGCNGTFEVEGTSDTQYTCPFSDPGLFTAIGRITDKDGGSTDYSISIEVLEPSQAIDKIVAAVEDLNLATGVDNSLDAKLDAVKQALEDINTNNDTAAISSLQAFINAVEAQRGKEISDEQADFLIAAAQRIIDSIVVG